MGSVLPRSLPFLEDKGLTVNTVGDESILIFIRPTSRHTQAPLKSSQTRVASIVKGALPNAALRRLAEGTGVV